MSITATASCRVDLAGGTLDLWPLYLFHPGAMTVNYALTVKTLCKITPRKDSRIILQSLDTVREDQFVDASALLKATTYQHGLPAYLCRYFLRRKLAARPGRQRGFEIETRSESPAGAGISGSSALMVATASALAHFTGFKLGLEEIRVIAQNVEAQLIRVPTGCQDYYPALYGGMNSVHLREDGVEREAIPMRPDEIAQRFVLVYTGSPRKSGINNWQVFQRHINGDRRIHRNFENIVRIANDMRQALVEGDWPQVSVLLRAEWKLRKANAPGITTQLIEKLVAVGKKKGALAAKVCGAGGGGCTIMLVEPGRKRSVEQALKAAGGVVLPAEMSMAGVTLVEE